MIIERIKLWALAYFAKYACPSRFSLSSETAKNNDFYETNVYFPQGTVEQLDSMLKERVATQNVLKSITFNSPSKTPSKIITMNATHKTVLKTDSLFSLQSGITQCFVNKEKNEQSRKNKTTEEIAQ
ncbi:hypothetical protein [Vibrio toranzoniae]|uniref:hypothetical protein n=1 Tax=Vibrio toranzoniae TaxID=1194427 RepID=UPI001F3D85E1|nr:hypothetical protein [Vibrio toranzoniae]